MMMADSDYLDTESNGLQYRVFEYCYETHIDRQKILGSDLLEEEIANCTYMLLQNRSQVEMILERKDMQPTSGEHNHIWIELSYILWWYLAVVSCSTLLLYGYYLKDLVCQKKMVTQPCLFAIILSDFVMLLFFVSGILVGVYRHALSGSGGDLICKFIMFTTNTSAFFTNWCWVILWGHKYMAVYHPFRHLRNRQQRRVKVVLVILVLVAGGCESWTLVLATEKTLDGVTYCDVDLGPSHHWVFSWVALAEIILSFFFPFAVILAADIAVLIKAYSPTIIMQVTLDDLTTRKKPLKPRMRYSSCPVETQSTNEGDEDVNNMKIMHPLYKERQLRIIAFILTNVVGYELNRMMEHTVLYTYLVVVKGRRKMRSIIRCTVTGSVDLLLNLPLYIWEISDNFVSFKTNYSEQWKVQAIVGSAVYMLYFLQFPLIIFYVRHVLNDPPSRSRKQSHMSDVVTRKSTVIPPCLSEVQPATLAPKNKSSVARRLRGDQSSSTLQCRIPRVVVSMQGESTVICTNQDIATIEFTQI